MRLVATISDNLQPLLDDQAEAITTALRTAIETASASLLDELRGQVRAAGLGTGLEKAWRREVYPRSRKRTFHPAALVYSKSTVLHDAFDAGPAITARRSRFLVIPTEAGRRLGLGTVPSSRKGGAVPGGQRRRYADLEPFADRLDAEVVSASRRAGGGRTRRSGARTGPRIVLVPARAGGLVALLYLRRDAKPVAIARLVPTVKLQKLLDIAGAEARAETALSAALAGG
jgi:hypothetical protein